MRGIEFVGSDSESGDADEELTAGARRSGGGRGRRRGPVLAVVALAALVVLAVTVHRSPSGGSAGRQEAQQAQQAQQAAQAQARQAAAQQAAGQRATDRYLGCPTTDSCRTTTSLPTAVLLALRARFPAVEVEGADSLATTARTALRTRQITATAGGLRIGVQVQPATDSYYPTAYSGRAGPANPLGTVYARAVDDGLAVAVSVVGPVASLPSAATVRSLADDPRLLATR